MSRHATPRGHLALIAVSQGRAGQLDRDTLLALAETGWTHVIHRHWRLTTAGRDALDNANQAAAASRLRSSA